MTPRRFLVSLPKDNYEKYLQQVQELLRLGKAEDTNLQILIGRLERTAYAVPNAKFFLNRLHHLQYTTTKKVGKHPTIHHQRSQTLGGVSPPIAPRHQYQQPNFPPPLTLCLGRLLPIWTRRIRSEWKSVETIYPIPPPISKHQQHPRLPRSDNQNLARSTQRTYPSTILHIRMQR